MMLMYVGKLEVYAVLNGSRNEKNIDYSDSVLQEIYFTLFGPSLYLYADVLPVRHGSTGKIRRYKGDLSCLQADSQMSSVCKRRL